MPKYRLKFIPRGSWEITVDAPTLARAQEVADEHFDTATRAADAEWDIEGVEVLPDDAEVEACDDEE